MRIDLTPLVGKGITAFHRRESWEPPQIAMATAFTKRPPLCTLSRMTRRAAHYTAAMDLADGDPGETPDQIARLLANSAWSYLRTRESGNGYTTKTGVWFPGYPLGYSYGFDHWGGVWEIRGSDFNPAATRAHNHYVFAFLMLSDRHDPGSEAMWLAHRTVARELVRHGAPLEDRPWPHRDFKLKLGTGTATACCGDALVAQINQGLGDLSRVDFPPEPEPEPEPEPPTGDIAMLTPGLYQPSDAAKKAHPNPPWFYKNELGLWTYADNTTGNEANEQGINRGPLTEDQYLNVHLQVFHRPFPL